MINLLPTDLKEEINFGRKNRVLLHWITAIVSVIALVGIMTIFGLININNNTKSLEAAAKITQDRISAQNLDEVQKDIRELSNNFTTITQLLKRQLIFSKLFVKIGSIIPNGAILSGISLSTSVSSLDLNIIAVDRNSATQSFVNISDPENGLFDKADLLNVSCVQVTANTPETATKYPCNSTIKVTMKTDSSYYFLNSISGSKD